MGQGWERRPNQSQYREVISIQTYVRGGNKEKNQKHVLGSCTCERRKGVDSPALGGRHPRDM